MLKPLLLGLAAFTVSAAIAQEAPRAPGGGRAMMRADANNDGVITRAEAIAQATERFDRMDLNKDGTLDAAELAQLGQRMRGMREMGGDMPPPPASAPAK